jgi:SAM-dependent methyltransferase
VIVRLLSWLRALLKKTGLLPLIKRVLYRPSTGDPSSARGGWGYKLKLLIEQANFAGMDEVHADLPPIYLYWNERFLVPMFRQFGFESVEDFYFQELVRALRGRAAPAQRVLSVGSGNGEFEVLLARRLVDAGLRDFRIDCMDINDRMQQRARSLAAAAQVGPHIAPLKADFNDWRPAAPGYAVVLANQSLHHVVNLEGLYESIRAALLPDGVFLVADMIGRNGHMRWPEALAIVDEYWQELPAAYRHDHLLGTTQEHYVNFDCSKAGFEGIRAQDVLPLLIGRFHFRLFVPFGNVIDPFVDRGIGPNFDPARPWDREFIDRVHARDVREMLAGTIKPTHMMAVLTLAAQGPTQHPPGLTPEFCVRVPG